MKTLIAVIAYNEEQNIRATLDDLRKHDFGYDVVVIDNGSADNTVAVCRSLGVRVLPHCVNAGGAMGTVTSYFRYAWLEGYDCLCQFDGDGQHVASELPKICQPIEAGQADYVIGSRFLEGKGFQSTTTRRLGIQIFSWLDSLIMGQRVTDVTSGFRAYNRSVMDFFARAYPYELHDTNQLLLASHFSGARILEVPVQMRERRHGVSEFNLLNSLVYPFLGVVNIAGVWLQRRQIRKFRQPSSKYGT
jgi:glycosyltransferase involved in cell wall biosynthesis